MASVLGSIREKLQNAIQHDLPSGLRELRLSETSLPIPGLTTSTSSFPILNNLKTSKNDKLFSETSNNNNSKFNPLTGSEMLEYFQNNWHEQRMISSRNVQLSGDIKSEMDNMSERILRLHRSFHNFANDSNDLNCLSKTLNDIDNEINKSLRLFSALEDAITDLDKEFESLDFRMRERECERKLIELSNRKEDDLTVLKAQLEVLNEQKRKQKEYKEAEISRERQRVFQEAFEDEIARYKSGTLPVKSKQNDCLLQNNHSVNVQSSECDLLNIDVANEDEFAELENFLAS